MITQNLKKLFSAKSVAVIGASNSIDKMGYHVMKSLVGKFSGGIYPINPKGERVWGLDSYVSVNDIPAEVDLAIIVVPAALVPDMLHQCGRKKVKGAVLITAGFGEIEGPEGAALQEAIRTICEEYQLPVIGPNTFGFVNVIAGLDASFTPEFLELEKGGVALISQSGGLCHLCGFLAMEERLGISALMSLGNRLNIGFSEAVKYFVEEDDSTRVIALYIEGLDEPREFLDSVRTFRHKKPIIVLKGGKNRKGDSASKFHTGSLAGNHRIWKGALRQAGILEVGSADEFIDTAKVLDTCSPATGTRIAILSGQAGPGMIAADALEANGLELAAFSPATQEKINSYLPPTAIRSNPIDLVHVWYNPRAIIEIMNIVLEDPDVDGIMFMAMYASANANMVSAMEAYMKENRAFTKPVVCVFTSPPGIWDNDIRALDGKKGIAILHTPERAARALANLWRNTVIAGEVR